MQMLFHQNIFSGLQHIFHLCCLAAPHGAEGRAYVERAYEVGACFDRVEEIYRRNMEEAR